MVYAQTRICPGEWDLWNSLEFWDTNRSPDIGQKPDFVLMNKKKELVIYCNFVFPMDHHHHHQHHHVMPLARISLTLSLHFFLSFIASGRSSGLHPVSSHCCCMYVRAGRPAFARPYVGVHRSTSLMSSSLLLQQCPACLVRLTWIVFVMGRIVGVLWGVAARTCSILLATFWCTTEWK